MPDYLPPGIGIPAGLIITAYVLLSEEQRWGRFLISRAKVALHNLLGGGHDR